MLNFGNVKEQPIAKIWEEMTSHFQGPSCDCYANVIHATVAKKKLTKWPITKEFSESVLCEHPPFNPDEIPVYYKKMGYSFKNTHLIKE